MRAQRTWKAVARGRCLVNGCLRQLKPLRSYLLKDGARFPVGRRFRQVQAMGGISNLRLSFID
jgi:hypothetical protein